MKRAADRDRRGFAAVWVLLVLTVVPAAFGLVVDGAAVVDAAQTGQTALASARATMAQDPALSWSAVVRADLPIQLAQQAAVAPGGNALTLRVPLPIPVRGIRTVSLLVRMPSARGAE
jgi:hypothetical protein